MANKKRSGRTRSAYSYSVKKGLKRHHRWVLAYFPMVIFLMSSAGALAYLQAGHARQAKPTTTVAAKAPSSQFANQPTAPVPLANDSSTLTTEDPKLAALLSNWTASHRQNQWSIAITGLSADTPSATYASNLSYNSASIFKLLLMYPLLSKIPRSAWNTVQLSTGDTQTSLSDCVDAMLRMSDNTCGDAVGSYVGWTYADAQLHRLGLNNTHLNNQTGPTTTTANVNLYLKSLYNSTSIDPGDRAYIMNIMQAQTTRNGIPTGCLDASPGCAVADKTGDLGFVRHDVAIVQYGAKAYALSIFTDGASYSQIAQLTVQIETYIAIH